MNKDIIVAKLNITSNYTNKEYNQRLPYSDKTIFLVDLKNIPGFYKIKVDKEIMIMSKLDFCGDAEPFELNVNNLDEGFRNRTGFRVAETSELNCSKCMYSDHESDKFGPGAFYCVKHTEVAALHTLIADEDVMPNAAYVCNEFVREEPFDGSFKHVKIHNEKWLDPAVQNLMDQFCSNIGRN